MPRRHTSSAAGALAAALLAAAAFTPAAAQDSVSPPGLRGSIGVQDGTVPPVFPATQPQPGLNGAGGTGMGGTGMGTGNGGAGGGNGTTGLGVSGSGNLADDPSLLPAPPPPPPPLGGLGDEPEDLGEDEGVQVVPGVGITDASGTPLVAPPSLDDDMDQLPLPPKGHELDPFIPTGMKLGSFLLFTEAEIGTILTDNVLGTRTHPQSDVAFEFAPNVRLQSNWSRHSFSAEFDADRSWYKDFSVEDAKTYYALLNGRLDVTHRSHLELELEKSQTQEGRNAISLTDIAGVQTNVQEQHITAAADHTFNRLTLRLEGTVAYYDYQDFNDPSLIIDPTTLTPIPSKDVRDYREDELILRGTYEFNPDVAVFVEGGINEEDYRQPISVEGIRRGSSGFELLSGMTFAFTDKLTGEFSVGWGQQESLDESLGPIEGMLFNADIIWRPTPLTMVEFLSRSDVSTTTLVDSLGAIDRYYELSVQHAFWRYLVVGGFVSYEIADYASNPLVDKRLKEGASAEYYFNPHVSMYARYEHTDFTSTDPASDFNENEIRLGMRIRH